MSPSFSHTLKANKHYHRTYIRKVSTNKEWLAEICIHKCLITGVFRGNWISYRMKKIMPCVFNARTVSCYLSLKHYCHDALLIVTVNASYVLQSCCTRLIASSKTWPQMWSLQHCRTMCCPLKPRHRTN